MKTRTKFWITICIALVIQSQISFAQKIDDDRMKRDIEVAENVLSTLIKQEVNQQRGFFGIDIKGTYLPGYGVTFQLPGDNSAPFMISIAGGANEMIFGPPGEDFSYTVTTEDGENMEVENDDQPGTYKLKDKAKQRKRLNMDSVRDDYNLKLIKASKDFILDYGDFISQLAPSERIIITTQGENNRGWFFNAGKRTHLSIEGLKSDIVAFRQSKLTRDQALTKIKVVNTESVDTKEPDMELLSSIFARLYRSDLSKTYFAEDNIYYERLKDYGVIYYMPVVSSVQSGDYGRLNMPTLGLEGIDQSTRDKKVVELYPKFELDVKENILEYGRTLKSLKDDELLVFNIALTKCKGCGIPSTVELSVKSAVLKDYGAGKMEKNAALSEFLIKKGPNQ